MKKYISKHIKMDSETLRIFACSSIQNAGILLKLPQIAMATAQMLFQRVYHTPDYTFDKYPIDITAMASLFLAAKVEEYPRKAREVIDVFVYTLYESLGRRISLDYYEFERVREELFTAERRLLKNLGFDLLSSHPHKFIITYYNAMVNALDPERNHWTGDKVRRLLQVAWNYCNDSLRTDVFVRYRTEVVACCCIEMACEDTNLMFPKSSSGLAWYQLFIDDEDELKEATQAIKKLSNYIKPTSTSIKAYIHMAKYI